jgi:hypothetical protein
VSSPLRDYAWLIVGGAIAICFSVLGLGVAAARQLGAIVPLPWGGIGIAVVIFAAFTALHFRLRLVRELEARRDEMERSAAASRLIRSATSDGRRWLRVVQENLEMVDDHNQAERERRLYLSGARAHADKLEQSFERIEGNQRRLDELRGGEPE